MKKIMKDEDYKPIVYDGYVPYLIYPNNQLCIFPHSVTKSRGGVINAVFRRWLPLEARKEINDVYEKGGYELPVQTRVFIEYSKLQVDQRLQESLNGFDWEVMDAIATLYTKPGDIIYLDSIYRVILGKKTGYPVTEPQRRMVDESIEKMRKISIELKILDLYEDSSINTALRSKNVKKGITRNYLIPCTIHEDQDSINGYTYGIRLLEEPPLLTYAKALGQISLYPPALIDTPLIKTRNVISLQSFLLRSIDQMYRDRDYGNEFSAVVEAKAIYQIAGKEKNTDREKARWREKTEKLLEYWIQKGYIDGYEVVRVTERQTVKGYRINLSNESRYWDYPEIPVSPLIEHPEQKKSLASGKMQEAPDELAIPKRKKMTVQG